MKKTVMKGSSSSKIFAFTVNIISLFTAAVFLFVYSTNAQIKSDQVNSSSITSKVNSVFSSQKVAGFRASRINSNYPNNQFPNSDYWVNVGESMSKKLKNFSPAAIWLVSLYQGEGKTRVGFPMDGLKYENILSSDTDQNEEFLKKFDEAGLKILLQVEPGEADIDLLVDLILSRYGHHKCIAGFGFDIEWYNPENFEYGEKVSDQNAERWEVKVKSYNPDYVFFLKHFNDKWMPKNYRGDILFIDDAQNVVSLEKLLEHFKQWGDSFAPSKVAFQIGYPSDKAWWSQLNDPPQNIGEAVLNAVPNTAGIFWVDFSIAQVFPMNHSTYDNTIVPEELVLSQNYPNPFNPATKIVFMLPYADFVELKVFNFLGEEITTLTSEMKNPGKHEVIFDASALGGLSSGIYFYRLKFGSYSVTKQMLMIK